MTNYELFSLLAELIGPSLAAVSAVFIFMRQRRIELDRKLFIEEGVAELVRNIQFSLNSSQINLATGLSICKQFCENSKYYEHTSSLNLQPIALKLINASSVYRLNFILGERTEIWYLCQNMTLTEQKAFQFLQNDVLNTINFLKNIEHNSEKEVVIKNWKDHVAKKYEEITDELEIGYKLTAALESVILNAEERMLKIFRSRSYIDKDLGKSTLKIISELDKAVYELTTGKESCMK